MRITAVFVLAAALHVSAAGFSQKVTLRFQNESLEKVILEIGRQSGIEILYNNDLLRKAGHISISVKDMDAREALAKALSETSLSFKMVEGMLVISPKPIAPSAPENASANTGVLLVHGKITDPDGKPLASVSVVNKTWAKAAQSDADGNFVIQAHEKDLLEFSIVGYATQQRKASGGNDAWSIVMRPYASSLTEVVMIAYGSSQKKDLTGSVSTVLAKDLQDIPFTTVDNAIAGKAAGVQVTKTDGTPGGAVRIRVRGSSSLLGGNDPLYVIDGVPVLVQSNYVSPGYDVGSPVGNDVTGQGGINSGMSTAFVNGLNSLGGLNIDDIESITILKDASSTAIYGSKAANGVVIITTKKGKKDMKPQVTFNYYGTLSTIARKPKLLNGSQYKMLLTEAAKNDNDARDLTGDPHTPMADQIVNSPSTFFGKANTNWQDLVTRSPLAHNAEIALQGGGAASRYYTSIAYNSTPGVVIGTDYQRISGKLNMENEIDKHLKFITNFNIGFTNQNIANGAFGQALRARPDYSPYDSTGNFTSFAGVGPSYQNFQNPLALTTATNNSKTTSILGSISGIYDFNPSLQFKSTVSLNSQTYNQRLYTPSYVQIGSFYGNVVSNGGIGNNANTRFTDWFVENTLGYNKEFKEKHLVNVLIGTSYETQKTSFFSATGSGYPNDNVLNNLSSAVTPLYVRGDDPTKPQSYLLSFYLRANYTYLDKYLFTFTGRSDGSSKFGPDNKFGYFPSGAVAWRISKEEFLKQITWIDDIKMRGSYGLTGTQNIGDQMYRSLYSPFSYGGVNALLPTQLGNPAIKWETTKQTDIGLDVSLFKNRLQATVDYYKKQTNGALLSLPVPPSSSYTSLLANVVDFRNSGVELSLQGDIIRTKNFRWNASVNITWNKSIVTRLNSDADLSQIKDLTGGVEYGNTTLIEGQPLGLIQGMKVTGIIRSAKDLDDYKRKLGNYASSFPYLNIGDPMFLLDTVTYASRGAAFPFFNALIGNGAPKYYGGFTQSFSYKNFDLNLYFTFSEGGHLMWGDHVSSLNFVGTSNANAVMLDRYTPTNANSSQPRLLLGDQLLYNTNLSIFSSSYVKLRTLSFNYRFNKSEWMKRAGVQGASIYASATNLFTITKYPGNDPETSDNAYSVTGGYFDVSNYPTTRTYSLGVKLAF